MEVLKTVAREAKGTEEWNSSRVMARVQVKVSECQVEVGTARTPGGVGQGAAQPLFVCVFRFRSRARDSCFGYPCHCDCGS